MKKLNTEEFLKNVRVKVGPTDYDYSETIYIDARTKLKIICKEHGPFYQLPSQHMRGQGCNMCSNNIFNIEKFIKKSTVTHGDKYDYSESIYTGSKDKLKIICKKHGPFYQNATDHMRGWGCRLCGIERQKKKKSLRTKEI